MIGGGLRLDQIFSSYYRERARFYFHYSLYSD